MRKMLSLLLALLLLAMPVISLAASPSEIMDLPEDRNSYVRVSFTPGVLPMDAESNTLISDLLNALSFEYAGSHKDDGTQNFAMVLSGQLALTLRMQEKDDVLYLGTSLLDTNISVKEDDVEKVSKQLIEAIGKANKMEEKDIEAITQLLFSGELISDVAETDDFAEVFTDMEWDWDALQAVIQRVYARAVTETVDMQSKDHEPAVKKITMSVTAQDMEDIYRALCDAVLKNDKFMQLAKQMNVTYTLDNEQVSAEEFYTKLPEKIREMFDQFEDMPIEWLLNDKDEVVSVTWAGVPKEGATFEGNPMPQLALSYKRLGTTDGKAHSLAFNIKQGEEDLTLSVDFLTDAEKRVYGALAVTKAKEDGTVENLFAFELDGTKDFRETEASYDVNANLTVGDFGVTVNVKSAASFDGKDAKSQTDVSFALLGEKPMVTVHVNKSTGDRTNAPEGMVLSDYLYLDFDKIVEGQMNDLKYLDEMRDIFSEDVVDLGAMSADELEAFVKDEQKTVVVNFVNILQMLPESVLQAVLGMAM